jgi:hypothetical protein
VPEVAECEKVVTLGRQLVCCVVWVCSVAVLVADVRMVLIDRLQRRRSPSVGLVRCVGSVCAGDRWIACFSGLPKMCDRWRVCASQASSNGRSEPVTGCHGECSAGLWDL